jgi:O-antigen ligase
VGANIAAAYFVIFVPMAFAVAITCKSQPKMRVFAFATGLMGLFGAFFTYSRQAYFILAFQLFLQAARRNLPLAIFVGITVSTYQLWAPDSVIERINMTEQADAAGGDEKLDESTESRFIIWDAATHLMASRPWGIGLNHFKREIGNYAPGFSQFDAHNAYVLVTTEAGILGGIAMIALLSGFVLLGRRVQKMDRSEDTQLLGGGFVISALGAMMANLFGSRIFDGEVMGNFWILGGLVARYYTLQLERREVA